MRFGIQNSEEERRKAEPVEKDASNFCVGIVRKPSPAAAEKEMLALWILQSLSILPESIAEPKHPAVTILLELVRRRKVGASLLGAEVLSLVDVGKTQTYYWLNKMREAGLVGQGKKKLVEQGAVRVLKGYYLAGPNLSYTLGSIKKEVGASIDGMVGVSERLQQVIMQESAVPQAPQKPEPA